MKHALLAALVFLAGCAAEPERTAVYGVAAESESPPGDDVAQVDDAAEPQASPPLTRDVPRPGTSPIATSSLSPIESKVAAAKVTDPKAAGPKAVDPKVAVGRARSDRLVYARGLERIMVSNGMPASVRVHEDGKAGPTPALMFHGQFSDTFVRRAVSEGEVLERARALGFRSVEFIDRGPGGNYVFELSKSGPLPKCAAHNRLCL
jgi:hypothetical protein